MADHLGIWFRRFGRCPPLARLILARSGVLAVGADVRRPRLVHRTLLDLLAVAGTRVGFAGIAKKAVREHGLMANEAATLLGPARPTWQGIRQHSCPTPPASGCRNSSSARATAAATSPLVVRAWTMASFI
jgi:hypothetical protein